MDGHQRRDVDRTEGKSCMIMEARHWHCEAPRGREMTDESPVHWAIWLTFILCINNRQRASPMTHLLLFNLLPYITAPKSHRSSHVALAVQTIYMAHNTKFVTRRSDPDLIRAVNIRHNPVLNLNIPHA